MADKFEKLKQLLGLPLEALQKSDDYFKNMVQDTDAFKAEQQGAQELYGMDEEQAREALQRKLDLAGSAGQMIGSIKPVSKVVGSPEAMQLARARAKMAPLDAVKQRQLAEKLSNIQEVPVALAEGGVANPATAKNLNPYKQAPRSAQPTSVAKDTSVVRPAEAAAALRAETPGSDLAKKAFEMSGGDPAKLAEFIKKLRSK